MAMPVDPDVTFNSTARPTDDSLATGEAEPQELLSLVLLWSRDEPDRIGEVFFFPYRRGGWVLGRASSQGEPPVEVARPYQQRPGDSIRRPLLASRRISRAQLRLRPNRGGLLIENIGSAELRVNGEAMPRALAFPGDCVELHHELLFLCAARPPVLPAAGHSGALHPFGEPDDHGMIGESPAAWRLRARLGLVAGIDGHVLLQGPSGSGKELAAAAIHGASEAGHLVSRNATTLPEGLIDAELFGNARNYPSPGAPARLGAIGEADGGTLFLDEIGEISHEAQAHLLRVLDHGEYQRLGEDRRRRSRFRLIGATNRPEEALKHDFLARLTRRIVLPGLDERREDIPLLARHMLRSFATKNPHLFEKGRLPRLHPRLVRGLVMCDYTTHARELNHLLWQAIEGWALEGQGKYMSLDVPLPEVRSRRHTDINDLTRENLLEAYRACDGVQTRVVEHLGLKNRFQLNRLEKKLGVSGDDR